MKDIENEIENCNRNIENNVQNSDLMDSNIITSLQNTDQVQNTEVKGSRYW